MDWLRDIVEASLGSLLARLFAPVLVAAPLVFLTVTLVMTDAASAAWHQAANPASEPLGVLEQRAGFDALASVGYIGESVLSFYDHASDSDDAVAARAGPHLKNSPHGLKVDEAIPDRVPKSWTRGQMEDAIAAYKTSVASRKAELAAFGAVGGGNPALRLGHARRITQEEAYLKSLEKALGR